MRQAFGVPILLAERLHLVTHHEPRRVPGRPVVNETGLTGRYRLDFAVDPAAAIDLPSVFTALEEQLGLRLESRTVVQKIVIDAAERPGED